MAVSEGKIGTRRTGRSRLEGLSIRGLSRRAMRCSPQMMEQSGLSILALRQSRFIGARRDSAPLLLEFRPAVEGLLCPYLGCGQSRIKICARQSFLLWQTLAQKNRQAADESVAGASSVHGLDLECRNDRNPVRSRRQTAALAKSNDHAPHSLTQKKLGALLCIIDRVNRHSCDCFGFALIGDEIIRGADFLVVNRLRRSGIHDTTNPVGLRELHGVIDGS